VVVLQSSQQTLEEAFGRICIPSILHEDIKRDAVLVDSMWICMPGRAAFWIARKLSKDETTWRCRPASGTTWSGRSPVGA
jgi:hypothetical protein